MQRRRADGVGTAAGGGPDPAARATAAVTVANVASRRIALRCQRVGAQHRGCAVLHGRGASCRTGRRDGAGGRPSQSGRPCNHRRCRCKCCIAPDFPALSTCWRATSGLHRVARPVRVVPHRPAGRRQRAFRTAVAWSSTVRTMLSPRAQRSGPVPAAPVRKAMGRASGATGLLRYARKDGMVMRLCIFKDTRPPHSFIKRDRPERTV